MSDPLIPAGLPAPFEWCFIPAGQVYLEWVRLLANEIALHEFKSEFVPELVVEVAPFYMAKYPITNAQYAVYVAETGYAPKFRRFWDDANFNQPLQPVIGLYWQEAMAFCQWVSEKAGYLITLPTDAQWQRAAQGDDRRKYPWSSDWDSMCCNTEASGMGHTTPVTQYPQGASPFGVIDMVGNVFEWCLTDPHDRTNILQFDMQVEPFSEIERIFKGSSYGSSTYSATITQYGATSIFFQYATGIRLVTNPP